MQTFLGGVALSCFVITGYYTPQSVISVNQEKKRHLQMHLLCMCDSCYVWRVCTQCPPVPLAVSPIQSAGSVGGVKTLGEEETMFRRERQRARRHKRAEEWWRAGGGVHVADGGHTQVNTDVYRYTTACTNLYLVLYGTRVRSFPIGLKAEDPVHTGQKKFQDFGLNVL